MKRLIISLSIIAVIVMVGIIAIYSVGEKNERLYGHIESVLAAYDSGEDVGAELSGLRAFFENEYVRALGAFVDDDRLAEISVSIDRLEPMYLSDCDEFSAECFTIRSLAENIYLNELPVLFRIL